MIDLSLETKNSLSFENPSGLNKSLASGDALFLSKYGFFPKKVGIVLSTAQNLTIEMEEDTSLAYSAQPPGTYYLPASRKNELQTALDTYRRVRLQERGDYRTGGLASITLRSGCQLFGLPGTRVPKIVVAPGTEGALANMLDADLEFPPSLLPTRYNRFYRIFGRVTVYNAVLEENEFMDLFESQINIDTRTQGHLRFNRFIKVMTRNTVTLLGDRLRGSYGNVFLWTNFLLPGGDALVVENQGDLTLVGLDIETWNHGGNSVKQAAFWTGSTGPIRIFAPNGGTYSTKPTGLFNVDADELQVFDEFIYNATNPQIVFGSQNRRSLFINVANQSVQDNATGAFRFTAFRSGTNYAVNGGVEGANLSDAQQAELRGMMVNPTRLGAPEPWERPAFTPPPDPAGPDWRSGLASRPDASAQIQALVNANGIARLGAGFYYLDKPVILRAGQGIIGAGMDKTVLIAKRADLDMIRVEASGFMNMSLVDITLQGGRTGVLHTGGGQQASGNNVSHVLFRDMAVAGMCFDKIYGYDNNFLDYVYFVHCASGFLQVTDPNYPPGRDTPTMSYMDKTVFYTLRGQ